jgi:integrase-like protein
VAQTGLRTPHGKLGTAYAIGLAPRRALLIRRPRMLPGRGDAAGTWRRSMFRSSVAAGSNNTGVVIGALIETAQWRRMPSACSKTADAGVTASPFSTIAPSLVSIISEHLASSTPEGDSKRWLFTGEGVDPPQTNTANHRWRTVRNWAGIGPIRLHDLRHFYASGLITAGCDVVTVQRALGHASATTTLNTYSHLLPTAEDRTRSAAEGLVRGTLDGTPADSVRTSAATSPLTWDNASPQVLKRNSTTSPSRMT